MPYKFTWLSDEKEYRNKKIIALRLQGKSINTIAEIMGVSYRVVESQINRYIKRLGVI